MKCVRTLKIFRKNCLLFVYTHMITFHKTQYKKIFKKLQLRKNLKKYIDHFLIKFFFSNIITRYINLHNGAFRNANFKDRKITVPMTISNFFLKARPVEFFLRISSIFYVQDFKKDYYFFLSYDSSLLRSRYDIGENRRAMQDRSSTCALAGPNNAQ